MSSVLTWALGWYERFNLISVPDHHVLEICHHQWQHLLPMLLTPLLCPDWEPMYFLYGEIRKAVPLGGWWSIILTSLETLLWPLDSTSVLISWASTMCQLEEYLEDVGLVPDHHNKVSHRYFGFLVHIKLYLHYSVICSFPYSSVDKESTCNAGDPGLIPGSERSPGEENGNPLQYSCLENPTDRGAWQAIVHGIARVRHDLVTKPPHSVIH